MIFIGKAPYRISLLGGGSDIEWFLNEKNYGYALGYSLNKFSYSVLKELPNTAKEGNLKYSSIERYTAIEDIVHPYIRESLKILNIKSFIEVATFGFASGGSGIGGSSSFLLSFLAALNSCFGKELNNHELAQIASTIEIEKLSKPIGRQDQFLSCLGDISCLKFEKQDKVIINQLSIAKKNMLNKEIDNLFLIPSFINRKADHVLQKLKNQSNSIDQFEEIRNIAEKFILTDEERESHLQEKFHTAVRDSWDIKRRMSNVMNAELNHKYNYINNSIPNNWIRLLGAGAGGYFLVSIKDDISNPEELMKSKGIVDFIKASKSEVGLSSCEL